jgi:hypothetical protein
LAASTRVSVHEPRLLRIRGYLRIHTKLDRKGIVLNQMKLRHLYREERRDFLYLSAIVDWSTRKALTLISSDILAALRGPLHQQHMCKPRLVAPQLNGGFQNIPK